FCIHLISRPTASTLFPYTTLFRSDFGVSPETPQSDVYQDGESFGLSVFLRDGEDVFRTYFTTHRGVEALGSVWTFLDLTSLGRQDRKSTRLNSSHVKISYAVFCLK